MNKHCDEESRFEIHFTERFRMLRGTFEFILNMASEWRTEQLLDYLRLLQGCDGFSPVIAKGYDSTR